ncbi:MAG: FGGY-family carbohydrate kinase [Geminicoccaceae bacterium]|nr:FGGY-family carbohydrate kinase [Geminicoccaceae bacterium]
MRRDELVLAADLGGSALKLGLVDVRGRLVAATARALLDREPEPGAVEQDAESWWSAFVDLARALASGRSDAIAGIALTGATRCFLLVDRAGVPLAPALMVRDRRAAAEAEDLAQRLSAETGPIDASHPLARLAWFARRAPERLQRAAHLLEPADFLAFRLTGEVGRDPVRARRVAGDAVRELAHRLALPLDLFPPVRPLGEILGRLRPEPARLLGLASGVPVVLAPMDAWCASFGVGALRPGRAYASLGSSLVAGLIVDRPITAPGLPSPMWAEGLWHLGGPGRTGGAVLDRFARLFGCTTGEFVAEAEREPADADAPFCHPWPDGERVPWRAPALRARLWNLGPETTRGAIALAVLEGLAFWVRLVLERAEVAAGLRAETVRISGGLCASSRLCRLLAEALGRRLLRFPAREGALLGAAGLALRALGVFPDLDASSEALERAQSPEPIEPDPEGVARRARRFACWYQELGCAASDGEV